MEQVIYYRMKEKSDSLSSLLGKAFVPLASTENLYRLDLVVYM